MLKASCDLTCSKWYYGLQGAAMLTADDADNADQNDFLICVIGVIRG
jgi:hypothetical protein